MSAVNEERDIFLSGIKLISPHPDCYYYLFSTHFSLSQDCKSDFTLKLIISHCKALKQTRQIELYKDERNNDKCFNSFTFCFVLGNIAYFFQLAFNIHHSDPKLSQTPSLFLTETNMIAAIA